MCVFVEMYGLHGWVAGLAVALGFVFAGPLEDLTWASVEMYEYLVTSFRDYSVVVMQWVLYLSCTWKTQHQSKTTDTDHSPESSDLATVNPGKAVDYSSHYSFNLYHLPMKQNICT